MTTALPMFTTQERHTPRQLSAIITSLNWWGTHAKHLERDLTGLPDGPYKRSLLQELLTLHRHESQALLDLRDATAHLCSQVVPAVRYAGDG